MAPAWRIEARSMSRYGAKDVSSSPTALKPARPQVWPAVLSGSGGAPTPRWREIATCSFQASKPSGNRDLLIPGVKSVGLHADCDVEIEPNLHAELLRQIGRRSQLPVGGPLHEFDELDLVGVLALTQRGASGIVRLPPRFRPFPPRLAEFVPQHLETGKVRQQGAALGAKFIKILLAARLGVGLESGKAPAQRPPLQ